MFFCRNSSFLTMLWKIWTFSLSAIWQRTSTHSVSTAKPWSKTTFCIGKALNCWLKYNIFWNNSFNLGSLGLLCKLVRRFSLEPVKQLLLSMCLNSQGGLCLDCTRTEVLRLWFFPTFPIALVIILRNLEEHYSSVNTNQ